MQEYPSAVAAVRQCGDLSHIPNLYWLCGRCGNWFREYAASHHENAHCGPSPLAVEAALDWVDRQIDRNPQMYEVLFSRNHNYQQQAFVISRLY